MTKDRQEQLLAMANQRAKETDFFMYHNWDDHIEVDEDLTMEELQWMEDNIVLVAQRKTLG